MTMQAQKEAARPGASIAAPNTAPGGTLRGVHTLSLGLVMRKIRRRLWSTHRSIAVVRELGASVPGPADGLRVDLVHPDEFTALPQLVEEAVGVEYLYVRPIERTRQARAGTMSVARTAAGDLVAFHFVHESHNHEALEQVAAQMYPELPRDEVLTEAVYCLPAWRGKAFAPRLLQATGEIMAARGKRRAWAYLDTTNVAALRMFNRAGYQPSGEERVDRYRLGRFSTAFRELTPRTRTEWDSILAGARPDTL